MRGESRLGSGRRAFVSEADAHPSNFVLTEDFEGVRLLTIDRPERANAYNRRLSDALVDAFVEADRAEHVRVVVLTGAGNGAFCAGKDLSEVVGEGAIPHPMRGERNVHEAAMGLYKPTIAAVNGPAVGGGCELALSCDMRIASETAFFQCPEVKRSMGANFASVVLPQLIPRALAMELLFTGRRLSASEALQSGLINRVVPKAETLSHALELATEISHNAPLSLQRVAHTARKSWGLPLAASLRLEAGPDPYLSEDNLEGARSFLEKRPPRWQGR
jgi:enoyl-CoA hydratase/carnithine racemase